MASAMISSLLLITISWCVVAYPVEDEVTPLENPDLFGGDMVGVNPQDRNAVVVGSMLWTNGVIPCEIDPGVYFYVEPFILHTAMQRYEEATCIRFVKRTTETDYVRMFPGNGCHSMVGKVGGAQALSLGKGCDVEAYILHELGHAIGFYHEQNRSDRDEYIRIIWENIKEGAEDQFFKLKPYQNALVTVFDYDSIMLYGSLTFSKDPKAGLRTMERLDGTILPEVSSKAKGKLSPSDIKRINILYNCEEL